MSRLVCPETAYATSSSTTPVYSITYNYDGDGNLATEVRTGTQATSNTYTYDLRNRMIEAVVGTSQTDYGYDIEGVMVSETTGANTSSASTTYYLNDPNNPTGYTKAIENKAGSSVATASVVRSYVLGLKVEAQNDPTNGTLYLLTDGQEILNGTALNYFLVSTERGR